jgi:hypothetical protein
MQPQNGDEVTLYNADGGAKPFLDAPPSRWTRGDYRGKGSYTQGAEGHVQSFMFTSV